MLEQKGDIHEEIAGSLKWLVDAIEFPEEHKDVVESIVPKLATTLLPVIRVRDCRRVFQGLHLPLSLQTGGWKLFSGMLKVMLLRHKWARTMEIACSAQAGVVHPSKGSKGKASVCIVSSMQAYARVCVHLANSLVGRGHSVALLAPQEADSWGVASELSGGSVLKALEQFVSEEMESSFRSNREIARTMWPRVSRKICDRGPQLVKELHQIVPGQLEYVVTEVIPQACMYKELASAALTSLQPSVLFVARLKRMTESVFALAAKELGMPVVLVNHGHIGSQWDPLSLGNVHTSCDAVLSWNEEQRRTWVKLFPELGAGKVHAIGGIQWDDPIRRYRNGNKISRRLVREHIAKTIKGQRPINTDEKWITITIDDHVKRVLQRVLRSLNRVDGFHLLIKTRPHESYADYSSIMKIRRSFPVSIISKETPIDLFDLLFASDLLLTCVSTTNFDGLAVGTPAVTLIMDRKARHLDRYVYLEKHNLPIVSSERDLRLMISEWLSDGDYDRRVRQAAYRAARVLLANYPDGDAGDKIEEIMTALQASRN